MPKIVGNDSLLRELVYTSRQFNVEEAKQIGLVRLVVQVGLMLTLVYVLLNFVLAVFLMIKNHWLMEV
jgi:enoyl-CoA hydratase/carnithine racemase